MTRNQIDYLKYVEDKRTNLANERLTDYRDKMRAVVDFRNSAEAKRHNLVTEQQQYAVLGENTRHNIAQEHVTSQNLSETSRHNKEQERLQLLNTKVSALDLKERGRHNRVAEAEQTRANRATEALTARRMAQELGLKRQDIQLGYANLAETARRNSQTAQLGYANLAEQQRANQAREEETRRSNQRNELEATRSHRTTERETERSNRAREDITRWQTVIQGAGKVGDLASGLLRTLVPLF